jgi:methyl-accepting chemotaxis protein
METVVQQNASSAEESASASEELSAQARNLKEMVEQLVVLVHGKIDRKYESLLRDEQGEHTYKQTYQNYQSNGNKNQAFRRQAPVNQLPDKRTKLVSPEEVIPLDQDNKEF